MTCSGSSTAAAPTNSTVGAAGNPTNASILLCLFVGAAESPTAPTNVRCIYSGQKILCPLPSLSLSQSLSSTLPLSLDADRAVAAPSTSGSTSFSPLAPFPFSAPPLFARVASLLPAPPPPVLVVDRFVHLRFHSSRARSTLSPAERESEGGSGEET